MPRDCSDTIATIATCAQSECRIIRNVGLNVLSQQIRRRTALPAPHVTAQCRTARRGPIWCESDH